MPYTHRTFDGYEITFTTADSGYVYCNMADRGRPGTLGCQICKGGGFTGSTLIADDDSLERVARRWLHAYYRHTPPQYRWQR